MSEAQGAGTGGTSIAGSKASPGFLAAIGEGGGDGGQGNAPQSFSQAFKQAVASPPPQIGTEARGNSFDPLKGPSDQERRQGTASDRRPRETTDDRDDGPHERADARERPQYDDDFEFEETINGEKRKVTLREMRDRYRRGESSNKKFQEAAELRKTVEREKAELQALLKDPKKLLERLVDDGDTAKTVFEAFEEAKRLANMTPEQQAEHFRQQELLGRDAKLREIEAREAAEAAEAQENQLIDQHLDGLEDAYEKLGFDPQGKLSDLTDLLATSIIEGCQEEGLDATYMDIAATVKEVIAETTKEHVAGLSDDQLREMIGPKRLAALMNGQVKQVQSRLPQTAPRPGGPRQPTGQFAPQQPKQIVYQPGDRKAFRALVEGNG